MVVVMKSLVSARRIRRLSAMCLALFVALSALGMILVRLESSERTAAADRLLVSQAAEIRASLGDELYQSINLARGLRAFVIAHPDLGDPDRFAVLLGELFAQGDHIRNIGIAPDNVLTHIHPLEGNEAAIGLRYDDVPEQFAAVELAIATRATVLAGPVDLVQGGRGLIDRTPVFLDDGTYWGVVSLVLDVDSLMASVAAGIDNDDLAWAIRTVASDFQPATHVAGDVDLFEHADATLTLAVPNGSWEMVIADAGGRGHDRTLSLVLHVAAVLVAALVSWLVFEATRERWRATTLSLHDELTGLANRRLLEDRAERALAQSQRDRSPVSLVFVDLDGFKQVNDQFGHEVGDAVLEETARRLTERVRRADTVARVGGDEFVVLAPTTDAYGARVLKEALEACMAEPMSVNGVPLDVGASFGEATYPDDGETFDELLRSADDRMYRAKSGATSSG